MISSRVDHCNSFLVKLPKTQINKLQRVMNSAAWLISGIGKFDHISPALESFHWLPVEYHIRFKVLCLAYKSLHGLAPAYLADLIKQYVPRRNLRSADQNLLMVPKIRTNRYGARAFKFAARSLFNSLPVDIQ